MRQELGKMWRSSGFKTAFGSKINRIVYSNKIILFVCLLSPKLSVFLNYHVSKYSAAENIFIKFGFLFCLVVFVWLVDFVMGKIVFTGLRMSGSALAD